MSDSLWPHGLYSPWSSPGQNTGVGSCSLLQGIFPTQGLNSGLLHCRQILCQLSFHGSPRILEWVTYPFFSGSSWPRHQTGVSCITSRFFTSWVIREALVKTEVHYNSQDMETTLMSISGWMDKEGIAHICNRILLSQKKEWNNATCRGKDAPEDCHTGWGKFTRDLRQRWTYDIAYARNQKRWHTLTQEEKVVAWSRFQ